MAFIQKVSRTDMKFQFLEINSQSLEYLTQIQKLESTCTAQ